MNVLRNIVNAVRHTWRNETQPAGEPVEEKVTWVAYEREYENREDAIAAGIAYWRRVYEEKLDRNSVQDMFKLFGLPDSFEGRRGLAPLYGIWSYTGTAEQNEKLLNAFLDDYLGPA